LNALATALGQNQEHDQPHCHVPNVGATWTAILRRPPLSPIERAAKRLFDVDIATVRLLTLMPLMLVTALLIKLDSRDPILFRQKRNAFNWEDFRYFQISNHACSRRRFFDLAGCAE
jgi:lipopolysaccharide/colanic/teichoic acid biosynthesis glycosyltransferase